MNNAYNDFVLKDLDGSGNELKINVGHDGDINVCIMNSNGQYHTVRIGIGPNSGGQDLNELDGGNYLIGALKNLAREFDYQNGLITKEEINNWRSAPRVTPLFESWF